MLPTCPNTSCIYIYYIGLKMNQTLILHLQIKAFLCQFFLVGRTQEQFSCLKSWHDQLLNQAPCQEKLVNFLLYTRANKTCQGKNRKEKLLVCAWLNCIHRSPNNDLTAYLYARIAYPLKRGAIYSMRIWSINANLNVYALMPSS
jgi:hypothetical protein